MKCCAQLLSPVKLTINLWLGGTMIVVLYSSSKRSLLPSLSLMLEDHKCFSVGPDVLVAWYKLN